VQNNYVDTHIAYNACRSRHFDRPSTTKCLLHAPGSS